MSIIISWISAHWAIVALAIKSLLDLAFVLQPSLDAPGGVIDYLYQLVKKAVSSTPPPSAPAA